MLKIDMTIGCAVDDQVLLYSDFLIRTGQIL